jgi:hypothetical protein
MTGVSYDREPAIAVPGTEREAWEGWADIVSELKGRVASLGREKTILVVDCYPGVRDGEILPALEKGLEPSLVVMAAEANRSREAVFGMIAGNVTDDRVFGVLSCHRIESFFDPGSIARLRASIGSAGKGLVLVYGVGASLIERGDILVYADLARWEIQQRMRRGEVGNWCADNRDEEFLRKYKRAFFVDWRVVDRHKASLLAGIEYLLDTNLRDLPKLATGRALFGGLALAVTRPFRLVPFFDPGPWGGQWMKKVCGLDPETVNYAWCFDCVPEENSLCFLFGKVRVEIPAMDLVLCRPVDLLGDRVHARFGAEFPIRFDFLDTMGGGNLSLQVHPLTEYIQGSFGMHYTQDESYYMLDAGPDAAVYLGLKEGIDPGEMFRDLEAAQTGTAPFDAEKYVNRWPAKKHDHFLIPGGTIHCSGRNAMVLEISATPFIFTFKLWDWGRLGLDGKPRPIHLDHGRRSIQWDRDTGWVRRNLIGRVERMGEGEGWVEERTGLHEREFIETRRHWFSRTVSHDSSGGVNVLNLIEGDEAVVESPTGAFEPFIVHYAETFVVPAGVGAYTVSPHGPSAGKTIGTIKAFVRT